MKHKLNISVANESSKGGIVTCRKKKMKRGLFKRLLGIDPDKVTIIIPGDSVKDVTIQEVAGAGGAKWCKYCPGRNICRKRSEDALSIDTERNWYKSNC